MFLSNESFSIILGILFKDGTNFYDHLPLLNSIDSNSSKDFYIILCMSSSCLVTFCNQRKMKLIYLLGPLLVIAKLGFKSDVTSIASSDGQNITLKTQTKEIVSLLPLQWLWVWNEMFKLWNMLNFCNRYWLRYQERAGTNSTDHAQSNYNDL